jgi:hypothetical protein
MITHTVVLPRAGSDYDTLAACMSEMASKWQTEANENGAEALLMLASGLTITQDEFRFSVTAVAN